MPASSMCGQPQPSSSEKPPSRKSSEFILISTGRTPSACSTATAILVDEGARGFEGHANSVLVSEGENWSGRWRARGICTLTNCIHQRRAPGGIPRCRRSRGLRRPRQARPAREVSEDAANPRPPADQLKGIAGEEGTPTSSGASRPARRAIHQSISSAPIERLAGGRHTRTMMSPTSPRARFSVSVTSVSLAEPSGSAMPSNVAERTKRLRSFIPERVYSSKSLGMKPPSHVMDAPQRVVAERGSTCMVSSSSVCVRTRSAGQKPCACGGWYKDTWRHATVCRHIAHDVLRRSAGAAASRSCVTRPLASIRPNYFTVVPAVAEYEVWMRWRTRRPHWKDGEALP